MAAVSTEVEFVGRERELALLHARLADAVAGAGSVVLLGGEPGIGKTRLAEELAAAARDRGLTALWGRCYEGEGAPAFWPWVQILRVVRRQSRRDGPSGWPATDDERLAQLLPEPSSSEGSPERAWVDSPDDRFRLFQSVIRVLSAAAADRPLLIILDDLHWADAPSLLLLEAVAREVRERRILLLATVRDVEVERGDPLAGTLGRLHGYPPAPA